jgi:hypothetical protein
MMASMYNASNFVVLFTSFHHKRYENLIILGLKFCTVMVARALLPKTVASAKLCL